MVWVSLVIDLVVLAARIDWNGTVMIIQIIFYINVNPNYDFDHGCMIFDRKVENEPTIILLPRLRRQPHK